MRSGQQNKRGRGRNNSGRKNGNPLTRTYDSTGPDVKIRGTAQHIADKYGSMARDALGAGDAIMAENYLQHAEHYNRIIASAQAQMQERYQREERDVAAREQQPSEPGDAASADGEVPVTAGREPNGAVADGTGPQPVVSGTPPELAIDEDSAPQPPRRQPSRRRSVIRPRRTRAGAAAETAPDMPAADDGASDASESRSSSGGTQDTTPEVAAAPET